MSGSNKWGQRPEHATDGNGAQFYDASEAARYDSTQTTNIIQKELTEKALELLGISLSSPEGAPPAAAAAPPPLIADIGCGSGLSGRTLTERGLPWVGADISPSMLRLASARPYCAGRLALADMAHGLPLRTAAFDAAVSISAVQWLCVAPRPAEAAAAFFAALARALAPAGRAALQVYLESDAQGKLLLGAAAAAGLAAGYAVDYPHRSPAKKYYILATKEERKEESGKDEFWGGLRCNLGWPAAACCTLRWLEWLGGEGRGDAAGAAAAGARARQEHAAVAKRALRLLRHAAAAAAGGAAPPPMPAASGDLATIEVAVSQPDLMPCRGPFVAHIHAGAQFLEDAQLGDDGEGRRAALAQLTGCSPEAATAATVSVSSRPGMGGGQGGWSGCLAAAAAAAADGEPSAKTPFFSLEPVGAGALAVLHATKPALPQLLVVPSGHAGGSPRSRVRWEGLGAARGRLEAWCRRRGACVVGVDAVLDVTGLSCAWLVYWEGLAGADRAALATDWALP